MARDVHVGDTGTVIIKNIVDEDNEPVNLVGADTLEIVFSGPSGQRNVLTATFVNDGTDGKIKVTTDEDTWSVAGEWREQVHIETSDGEWHCKSELRRVLPVY